MTTTQQTPAASSPRPRGAFIVLEGLDRAGKTTQCARLCARLEAAGHAVHAMRFPDRNTPVGRTIDAYLRAGSDNALGGDDEKHELSDHAAHLLFAANRWEAAARMEGLLQRGTSIVCDRYYYSGLVYTQAKGNPALSMAWARQAEIGLPEADLMVYLDLEPEVQESRGGFGEERFERREMQEKVRRGFLGLVERSGSMGNMRRIDAGGSVDAVADVLWNHVQVVMDAAKKGQLGERVARVQP